MPAPTSPTTNGHTAAHQTVEEASQSWTSAAKKYAAFMHGLTMRAAADLVRSTTALVPFTPTSLVHDVGCGSGSLTISILEAEPAATVVATDVSQGMVDLMAAQGLAGVRARVADAMDLRGALGDEEGGDAVYTHVMSSFMIQFAPEFWTPVREMQRILKPGGAIGLASWGGLGFAETVEKVAKRLDPSVPFRLGFSSGWPRDKEGVRERLVEMGFVDVKAWELVMDIPVPPEALIEYLFEGGNPTAQDIIAAWKDVGKLDLLISETRKEAIAHVGPFTATAVLAVARKP